MRVGIVAILTALAICLTVPGCLAVPGARAQADCANWQSGDFFKTASAADVRACLRAGADPGARDEDGRTLLHGAAGAGNTAAIAALLAAGADPGAQTKDGRTLFDLIPGDSPLVGTAAYWRLSDARWD